MNFRKVLISGLLAANLMLMPSTLLAQDAKETAPAEEASADAAQPAATPNDNWLKICGPIDGGGQACLLQQTVTRNGQFYGSFTLRNDPGQESRLHAVAALPLGILLPFSMFWQIDGGKPVRVPYWICDKFTCISQLVVNENYVNSLKKGSKLKLIAKTQKNQDFIVEINLAGFTAVYESDTAQTFEEYRKESSGANELERQLQDRAEQIRQQKNGTAPKSE